MTAHLNEKQEKSHLLYINVHNPTPPHVKGLKSVNLMFLLPSTTSKTQPMDGGVMRVFKAHYRSKVVQMYISVIDSNKPQPQINMSVAVDMLVRV